MNGFENKLANCITTERLILRAPILEDAQKLQQLANNKSLHKMLAQLPYPYKKQHAVDFILNSARCNEEHAYAITTKLGEFIGVIGFRSEEKGLDLNYWLGEVFFGKGYATEAAQALVNATFKAGIKTIYSSAISTNIASIHILKKIGFTVIDERIDNCGQHKDIKITYLKFIG